MFAAGVGVGLALSDASAGRALIIVSYWSSVMKPRSARASSSWWLLVLSQSIVVVKLYSLDKSKRLVIGSTLRSFFGHGILINMDVVDL